MLHGKLAINVHHIIHLSNENLENTFLIQAAKSKNKDFLCKNSCMCRFYSENTNMVPHIVINLKLGTTYKTMAMHIIYSIWHSSIYK